MDMSIRSSHPYTMSLPPCLSFMTTLQHTLVCFQKHCNIIYIPSKYNLVFQYTLEYLPNIVQYLQKPSNNFDLYYNTISILLHISSCTSKLYSLSCHIIILQKLWHCIVIQKHPSTCHEVLHYVIFNVAA
jgi:hypothetical protein